MVELLVYGWWTTFQSCSSSLLYTCPTWAPTKPGDEGGVWFSCEKLKNTFSWVWSLPNEEIFFHRAVSRKQECYIQFMSSEPVVSIIQCFWWWSAKIMHLGLHGRDQPSCLCHPELWTTHFALKFKLALGHHDQERWQLHQCLSLKSEKLSSVLMAAGLFSVFQQCERKGRSIMHLTPTLLMDGQTRFFFSADT